MSLTAKHGRRASTLDPSKLRLLRLFGPGLVTGASDDDPSGIGTYSQAGAQFGFTISWTMLFSYDGRDTADQRQDRSYYRQRRRRQSSSALSLGVAPSHRRSALSCKYDQYRRGPRRNGRRSRIADRGAGIAVRHPVRHVVCDIASVHDLSALRRRAEVADRRPLRLFRDGHDRAYSVG